MVLVIGCIVCLVSCRAGAQKSTVAADRVPAGLQFVEDLAAGKFTDAVANFDDRMSQAMSADQLKQAWQSIMSQCGSFKKTGETRTTQEAGFDVVFAECQFEKTSLDVKVVFDKEGKIAGLWFVPHIGKAESEYAPPKYAQENRFEETNVAVGSEEWVLPGILTMPKGDGPFPAVVLVHGSGPNDKDESIGANKPFKDLAWGLATKGIAVLRYDKRTKVYSTKMASTVESLTVKEETIDDVLAAVEVLRGHAKIDSKRIFVLGHSLGGMLIPRIGKADPKLAGLIVMAGPTRPLEDIILDQATYLASSSGDPSPEVRKQLDEVKRQVEMVKDPKLSRSTPTASLIFGVPAAYWLDLRGYRPAEVAKTLKQPILILQGGRDYQVTKADYDGWVKALKDRKNITFKYYPDLNHLFMTGEGKSTPQDYEKRGPVAEKAVADIINWLTAIK